MALTPAQANAAIDGLDENGQLLANELTRKVAEAYAELAAIATIWAKLSVKYNDGFISGDQLNDMFSLAILQTALFSAGITMDDPTGIIQKLADLIEAERNEVAGIQ